MPLFRDDKLEESLGRDKASIRKSEMFRRCLTDEGFARYVRSFYETVEGVCVDARSDFGNGEIDAAGKYWKNGEKVSIFVLCRHGGGATSEDGRRYVEKAEVAEFFEKVKFVRDAVSHETFFICATSVWFSSDARNFCRSNDIAAIDFSGLLKMDQAYPLERFVKEMGEAGSIKECFSTFWLGKYLPEYARTEAAVKRTRLDSKSALGALLADVEKTASETYINPFDTAPESIVSFATILEAPREESTPEPYVPVTIFNEHKLEKRKPVSKFKIAFAGLAVCSVAFYASLSGPSEPSLSTSAVQSLSGSSLS